MNTFVRRSPRHSDVDGGRDRELAARLPDLQHDLERAVAALGEGQRAGLAPSAIRSRYRAMVAAYDAAIAAAEAALRVAVGPLDGLAYTRVLAARGRPVARAARDALEQLRIRRQRHLLDASPASGALVPSVVRTSSHAALGPHIPGMHFDPAPAVGPPEQCRYGVDLPVALDAGVGTPELTAVSARPARVVAVQQPVPAEPPISAEQPLPAREPVARRAPAAPAVPAQVGGEVEQERQPAMA